MVLQDKLQMKLLRVALPYAFHVIAWCALLDVRQSLKEKPGGGVKGLNLPSVF